MRKISGATVAMILAIALYFTLVLGLRRAAHADLADLRARGRVALAIRVRHRPPARARADGADPARRLLRNPQARRRRHLRRAHRRPFPQHGERQAGVGSSGRRLILVVLITIASVGPAVWSQNAELVREQTIQLALAPRLPPRSAWSSAAMAAAAAGEPVDRLPPPSAARTRPGSRPGAEAAGFKLNDREYLPLARPQGRATFAFATSAMTSAASLKAWLAAGTPQ